MDNNMNDHRRDEFDKSLRMIINNPDHFVDMFSQVIGNIDANSPRNMSVMSKYNNMDKDSIRAFYENSSVGEYEKSIDLLSGIMDDTNEIELSVLCGALDIKMVEKMDEEAQLKKEYGNDFNKIPEPVEDGIPTMVMESEHSFGY